MADRRRRSAKYMIDDHQFIDCGLFPPDAKRFKWIRPIKPSREHYQVALDYLPYMMLASDLTYAFVHNIAFGTMPDKTSTTEDSSSGFG